MTTAMCDIIMPIWNQPAVTRECIDSLARHTDHPFRIILVDNGSDEETASYLRGVAARGDLTVTLIRNRENRGFVKAVNQGMAISEAPYLCIMNNDTIATAGWLSELIAIMERTPAIGILNPSSNTSGQFPADGESIDDCARRLAAERGRVQELYTCRGFCMVLRREVYVALGPLDEAYHLGYFDDTDYCKKAQLKGFRTARAKGSYVYHKENTSFKTLNDNSKLFRDNERIFFERWGRPVRIGYFLDGAGDPGSVDRIAVRVARSGHQITLFMKNGAVWPVALDHFDIRRTDLAPLVFFPLSFYKVMKRKKKKKLDILLTDSIPFYRFLKMTAPLHGSIALLDTDSGALDRAVQVKTREF